MLRHRICLCQQPAQSFLYPETEEVETEEPAGAGTGAVAEARAGAGAGAGGVKVLGVEMLTYCAALGESRGAKAGPLPAKLKQVLSRMM